MLFWISILALGLFCGAILAFTLLRGRTGSQPPAAYDLQVYRDQLKEVDRDLARGVIGAEDADRIRAEVSRRILAADAQVQAGGDTGGQPHLAGWALAATALVLLVGGSVALYQSMGAPGYKDLPLKARIAASDAARAARLSQTEVEARVPQADVPPELSEEYAALMEKLRQAVKDRPDDLRGLGLLVRNEAALGNLTAAHTAQAQIITIKGPEATADDYAHHADLMISAAQGYISTEAEKSLREALRRNPSEPRAQYYLGLYMLQVDRPDAAFRIWDRLLRASPPNAPWVSPIRGRIEEVAWRAGVEYELPALPDTTQAAGPSEEDIKAAGEMTSEDRGAMIRSMVARLSERLAAEGGTPDEWARLIGAYGVLGETEQADAIWEEAQTIFGAEPDALDIIRDAARDAGVTQ